MSILSRFSKKFKIYLMEKRYGVYTIHKILALSEIKDVVSYKNSKYIIHVDKPSFISRDNKMIYLVDIHDGKQVNLHEIEPSVNPEDLDLIVGNKMVRELTRGVMNNTKDQILMIILGAVLGGLIVAVFLIQYFNGQIQDILTESVNGNPYVPVIPNM